MIHTPGPWVLRPNSKNSKGVYATVKAYPLSDSPVTTLSLVCEARICHADARLISAAPEMLVMLETLCDVIINSPTADRSQLWKLQTIIAKAKGES